MANEPQTPDKITVILDTTFEKDGKSIVVKADLEYLMADIQDYKAHLLISRGIPSDPEGIAPDDPLIQYVLGLPDFVNKPESTRAEKDAKNLLVLNTIKGYYEQQHSQIDGDALLLALTIENEFTDDPVEYPEVVAPRKRPGLVTMPEVKRNLANPVERRLKQLYDRLMEIPGALAELQKVVKTLSIDMQRRLQLVDKSGFRS